MTCWQVGSNEEAAAALDAGGDLIVAQGIEAGGHIRGRIALLDQPYWAGEGVGNVRSILSAAEVVNQLSTEAENQLKPWTWRQDKKVKGFLLVP